jgi:hypothetical protein
MGASGKPLHLSLSFRTVHLLRNESNTTIASDLPPVNSPGLSENGDAAVMRLRARR